MSKKEKVLVAVLVLVSVGIIGCSAFQDVIVPAYVDPNAPVYADASPTVFTPYTSLWDLRRIKEKVRQKHILNQSALKHVAEQDELHYSFITDSLILAEADAVELKNNLLSPSSPIGTLLPMLTGLSLGWIGLSKPSDKRKLNGEK